MTATNRFKALIIGLTAMLAGALVLANVGPVGASATGPDAQLAAACSVKLAANPSADPVLRAWLTSCRDGLSLPDTAATTPPPPAPTTAAPTPTATAQPTQAPATAYPAEASTGYRDGGALTAAGTCSLGTANAVYDHKLFDCSAASWLAINAAGVKITNSVVYVGLYGGVEINGAGGVVIEDTTVQAKGSNAYARESAVSGGGFTLRRSKVLSGGDGVFISGNNVVLADNYLRQQPLPGAHSDGVQRYSGGSGVAILHNTIVQDTASTAPIFWSGPSVVIKDNALSGGSYSLRMGGTSANGSTVTGNRIARGSYQYGPTLYDAHGFAACSDNLLTDADYVSNPAPLAC